MSIKTTIKRTALIAVAALGLGLISSVPSQASIDAAPTVTVTAGSGATTQVSDSTTAATIAIRYFASGGAGAAADGSDDTVTLQVSLGTKPSTATLDSRTILMTALDTSTSSGGVPSLLGKGSNAYLTNAWQSGTGATALGKDSMTVATAKGIMKPSAVGFAYTKWGFFLDTNVAAHNKVAGTYTFDYVIRVYSGGVLDTAKSSTGSVNYVVTTAGAAAAGAVAAAGTSSALMSSGSSYSAVTVDDAVNVVNTPSTSTPSAVIRVTLKTSAGDPAMESITATTTIGNVGDGTTNGKSVTLVGNANGINDINVYADGTSGIATITIKSTSVTFTAKQVTFYSTTVDKYVVTTLASVLGSSASSALLVKTYDATGNLITNDTSAYAYSSNLDVIATGTTTGTACTYVAAYLGQICSLSGASDGTADITIRNKSTVALSTKASTAVTLTVNTQAAAKVSLAFDKASYAPGEAAYIRVVAVDAAGKAVGPNSAYANLLASGGITTNVAFGNASDTTTATTINLRTTTTSTSYGSGGVINGGYPSTTAIGLYRVYMPYTGGTVTITATGGTALPVANQVAVTASATVADNGASALAAVTALASQVSAFITKINAQITTLTDLVMKIQKKVKA